MKQIPNLFTLLNLVCGCIAIVLLLQTNETIAPYFQDNQAVPQMFPEKMSWGALFIFVAAVIDFLDGFLARMLKASGRMGEQLDSLSDVVSFGVAPGVILYQLLRRSYAATDSGLDVSIVALLPAFIFTCAAAWRLAKFNISSNQQYGFRGVPTPAAGLFIASFPLIIWYDYAGVQELLLNRWFLYFVILIVSYLMVSNLRLMAMKFRNFRLADNALKFILIIVSIVLVVLLRWLAVPAIFVLYVLLSLFDKKEVEPVVVSATKDITV